MKFRKRYGFLMVLADLKGSKVCLVYHFWPFVLFGIELKRRNMQGVFVSSLSLQSSFALNTTYYRCRPLGRA